MRARFLAAAAMVLGASAPGNALTVSGTYYEDTQSGGCPNSAICTVAFPLASVSAGMFLMLEEISCGVYLQGTVRQASYFLTDGGFSTNARRYHYLDILPNEGGTTFREPTSFKITGGPPRTLVINVVANASQTSITTNCTIKGTLSPQ